VGESPSLRKWSGGSTLPATVEWPQQQDVPAFQQKLTEHPGASKVGLQEAPHAGFRSPFRVTGNVGGTGCFASVRDFIQAVTTCG
jgi:hypothetical protein